MSRIHEALKKAEQERAAVVTTEAEAIASPADPVVAASAPKSEAMPSIQDVMARTVPVAPTGYLRFDDLRAKCAHPEWHLDENVNVFANPALAARGAEQFRT
jgi:hypothetical protein